MEGSGGAPPVDNTEAAECGGSSSGNETERAGNKRLKLEEKQDRISDLPDELIQHILSFLPSTKQAIQTAILSKRWQNQWTRVPLLIFDSTGKKDENFSQFIDTTLTLHDCSKLKKFHIAYDVRLGSDPQLASKILFATRKDVEELILHLSPLDEDGEIPYVLPKFFFENASLVKLELVDCFIEPDQSVNWSSLKELKLECSHICSLAIANTVSGCPLLESLELSWINGFHSVVIASQSLKRLIFVNFGLGVEEFDDQIEISCPNLVELFVKTSDYRGREWNVLPDEAIQNVLSRSPLLHTLELSDCYCFDRFLIASKSLEKLVLGELELQGLLEFEISCPNLEELNLCNFMPYVPPFEDFESESRCERHLAVKILEQLQHVKLLEIGSWFLKRRKLGYISDVNDCRKKMYWNPNETSFNCSVSHLKIVKIVGLSKMDEIQKLVFNFVEFLLKNARMLEKIVIISVNCGTGFRFEISEQLLRFQRCFPHTTIELLCSD